MPKSPCARCGQLTLHTADDPQPLCDACTEAKNWQRIVLDIAAGDMPAPPLDAVREYWEGKDTPSGGYPPDFAALLASLHKGQPVEGLRVELGRGVNRMLESGASQYDVVVYIRKNSGSYYSWRTIDAWARAAAVEDTLPNGLRNVFGVYALADFGRIGDKDERARLASALASRGRTSNRDVRTAVEMWFERRA
jgi:hypothetical protein